MWEVRGENFEGIRFANSFEHPTSNLSLHTSLLSGASFLQMNYFESPEAAKNKHGAKGEAGRRGAYWVVREHRTASLTKQGAVLQRPPRSR
jgi:hypothetical protein